jgi:hypothetical protein
MTGVGPTSRFRGPRYERLPILDTGEREVDASLSGWKGRYFHSDGISLACYTVAAGASIHEHRHLNEEVWHIIDGTLEVTVGDETWIAGPGAMVVIPPAHAPFGDGPQRRPLDRRQLPAALRGW